MSPTAVDAVRARRRAPHLWGVAAVLGALLLLAGVLVTRDSGGSAGTAAPPTTVEPLEPTPVPPTTSPPMEAARQPVLGHPSPEDEPGAPGGLLQVDHARVDVPVSSLIAEAVGPEVGITAEPDGPATMVLSGTTSFGSARVFLLTGAEFGDWVEVWLPVRPNESRGWVQRDAVRITQTSYAVGIDLEGRAFTLFDGGVPVLTVPVAIGRQGAPTPTGNFFVTDVISTPSPGGSYGPYAFGLSGYSDVFTEFQGGDGQVGFHGTNEPWSIGDQVSAGCVRLPNAAIAQLVGLLPLGTPTIIV